MNLIRILLTTIKKYKALLFLGIVSSFVSVAISLGVPFLNKALIDDGIFANNKGVLQMLCILIVALYIADYFFKVISSYVFTKISKEYTKNIYLKVIDNLLYKKHQFFIDNNSGELLQRINETWNLEDAFSIQLFESVLSVFTFFIALGILLSLSVPITILVFIGIIMIGISYYFSNRLMGILMPKVLDKNTHATSKLQEILLGVFEIRSNNAASLFKKNNEKIVDEKNKLTLKFAVIIPAVFNVTNTLMLILMASILYLAGIDIISGTLTFGTYYLIVSYAQKVVAPVMQAGGIINSLKPVLILAKRIKEYFSLDEDDNAPTILELRTIDKITANNISYRYPNSSKNILSNFNFEAKKGEIILIKGENGSGKTTLLNIICGEIRPDTGTVLFDDKEGDSLSCLSWARQRPYVFNLNLQDNIILSEQFNEARYKEIIDLLQFEDYFQSDLLNDQTIIQENGNALSGGQIKIIAFARCLYRNRTIMVLDEIFSNLDSKMRSLILKYINNHRQNHIFIIVEHTNEFDCMADQILNIEDYK